VDYGVDLGDPTELAPGQRHASIRVFDSLKNAMAVYGGSGGKRTKRECYEAGS